MEKTTLEDGQVHYELLYLIANKYSENELDPIKAKVDKLITDNGGKITLSQDWGKKRLSYAIKGFYHGYYHLLEFNLTPDKTKAVDNALRLSSEILRHQIVKAKLRTEEEIKALEALKEKITAKQTQTADDAIASKKEADEKFTVTNKVEETKEETKPEVKAEDLSSVASAKEETNKLELNDLDDKLNELLANDNLL